MNFEEALDFVDAAVFGQAGRHLSAPEVTILQGTWQGMTYDQMAEISQYSLNYLMRDIGPRFWRLFSEALGEEVSKTNFRVVIERRALTIPVHLENRSRSYKAEQMAENKLITTYQTTQNNSLPDPIATYDWSEAPELSTLYGRSQELTMLKEWIADGCREIAIRGIRGIGKTALARQLLEEMQQEFDRTIWCSLNPALPLKELVSNLQKILAAPSLRYDSDSLASLMSYLRSSHTLLILDGVEAILQSGQLAGRYREGYEEYGEFFRRIGEESHQSCLILTSLENPKDISFLEGETTPVRSLVLAGLPMADAQEILATEGLGDRDRWSTLIEHYQGNPAALKLAAKFIRELFNGNVAEFLERETFVFGDIGELLAPLMARLSELEKELLYWLAIERRPISFATLEQNITLPISDSELLEVLASLGQRSLIETTISEKGKSLFTLAPMVMEYVISQLIEQISGIPNRPKISRHQWQATEDTIELTPSPKQPVNLGQWFKHSPEVMWQPIEALLVKSQLSPRLRSIYHLRSEGAIKRFKPIQFRDQEVALLVAIAQDSDRKVSIRVQVQPMGEDSVLPANLKLALLNETGQTLREVTTQSQDNFIQLPRFRGEDREKFSIQMTHNALNIKEDFII
jgi:Protein of unknown function (DUF1822)/NB-ARC domain